MPEHYVFVDWKHPLHPGVPLCCLYEHVGSTVRKVSIEKICLCPELELERSAAYVRALARLEAEDQEANAALS